MENDPKPPEGDIEPDRLVEGAQQLVSEGHGTDDPEKLAELNAEALAILDDPKAVQTIVGPAAAEAASNLTFESIPLGLQKNILDAIRTNRGDGAMSWNEKSLGTVVLISREGRQRLLLNGREVSIPGAAPNESDEAAVKDYSYNELPFWATNAIRSRLKSSGMYTQTVNGINLTINNGKVSYDGKEVVELPAMSEDTVTAEQITPRQSAQEVEPDASTSKTPVVDSPLNSQTEAPQPTSPDRINSSVEGKGETIEAALGLLGQNSKVNELRLQLQREQTALDQSSSALRQILTGKVDQQISLDQDAAEKLVDFLKPANIPGLSVVQEWDNITDHGNYANDGAESGEKLLKLTFQGNESYLRVSYKERRTVSAILQKH